MEVFLGGICLDFYLIFIPGVLISTYFAVLLLLLWCFQQPEGTQTGSFLAPAGHWARCASCRLVPL